MTILFLCGDCSHKWQRRVGNISDRTYVRIATRARCGKCKSKLVAGSGSHPLIFQGREYIFSFIAHMF